MVSKYQANTCRFCGKAEIGVWSHSKHLIKYGTRHYAHPRCYLDAGKKMGALQAHAIRGMFPDGLTKTQRDERDRYIRMMDLLGNG